jgi:FkbM family methyltransferase
LKLCKNFFRGAAKKSRASTLASTAESRKFESLTRELDRKLVVVDVGCRWGFADIWEKLSPHVKLFGFDPDVEECERLRPLYEGKDVTLVPQALADRAGKRTLYLTADPACSSLYQPNDALTKRFADLACAAEKSVTTVDVITLDDWALSSGVDTIDFLKLDTQGAELDILKGGERVLLSVRALEVEVEFNPIYRDQPLFGDVDRHLRDRGFVLWKLSTLAHYSDLSSVQDHEQLDTFFYNSHSVAKPTYAGQLFWGHAYYVRSELAALSYNLARPTVQDQITRDAALMEVLNFRDLAEALLALRERLAFSGSKRSNRGD